MALGLPRLMQLPRRTQLLFGAILVLTIFLVGIIGWTLIDARAAAGRQAEQGGRNIALRLERSITREIAAIDQSVRAAKKGMETPGVMALTPDLRQAVLFNGSDGTQDAAGVMVADETGAVQFASMPLGRSMNILDRAYFQQLRSNPDLGMIISEPLQGRYNDAWTLIVARRINHPDGSFAGVAFSPLDLTFFDSLFGTVDLGPGDVISIYSSAASVIRRRPFVDGDIGRTVINPERHAHLIEMRAFSKEFPATRENIDRLDVYEPIEHLPMILEVGISSSRIYATWLEKIELILAATTALFALGVVLVWLLQLAFLRRVSAEETARASERRALAANIRLNTLFEASHDAMVLLRVEPNRQFIYEAINPISEVLTGVLAESAIEQTPEQILPKDLAELSVKAWSQCVEEARPVSYEFTVSDRGDETTWEALVAPVNSEDGVIHRLIVVSRNITDRLRLEAGLREAQRMEAVGQLTAGLAHDFNNLLQGVCGATEILSEKDEMDEEARECIDIARQAAARGATLVHRLLAFTRQQVLTPILLWPADILSDVLPLLHQTLTDRMRLETKVDAAVGAVNVDSSQLEGCLLNLVLNARDAMAGRGVMRLRISNATPQDSLAAGLPEAEYVRFAVEDTGAGMSTEVQARVFEPFFTTKGIGKGSGLGLSMVRGFAQQSGGEVTIDSVPGQGSIVSLWLPVAAAARPVRKLAKAPVPSQQHRILIADDVGTVRKTLTLMLNQGGFSPVAVGSAEEALDLVEAGEEFDLVITDQSMEGMSGTELIAALADLRPTWPTLLISGFDMVSGLDQFEGNVTLLHKPFARDVFLQHVRTLLGIAEPQVIAPDPTKSNVVPFRAETIAS